VSIAAVSQRLPQRKRGVALEEAILEASYAELAASGYVGFTVEGVAARARTGKASIYRRWPTKQLLVLETLLMRLPAPAECGIVPDLPDDVTTVDALRGIARVIGGVLASPAGLAMRAIKCEAVADPQLARVIDERFQGPRRAALLDLLRRGVQRGEVRPEAVTPLIADVLPAVLTHRFIFQGDAVTEAVITEIVDEILVPLISPVSPIPPISPR
jgi:AcrR family transcriptional regulator